jgi:hypothetical protein
VLQCSSSLYIYMILYVFISLYLYVVLQLLCPCSRPSTPMDASMHVSTNDVVVEEACSFGEPHTHVCVTFDRFIMVIFLLLCYPLIFNVLVFL